MDYNTPHRLSKEAFDRLKEIYREEFGGNALDDELHDIGIRLLKLLKLLVELDSGSQGQQENIPEVTEREFQVLKYLHHGIYHDAHRVTIRGLAAAAGLRSSRSGFRLLQKLIRRGLTYRDPERKLQLAESVRGCNPKIRKVA